MRVVESIVDCLLMLIVIIPLLYAVYGGSVFVSEEIVMGGAHFYISYVLPFVLLNIPPLPLRS